MNHFDADQFRADWADLQQRISNLEQAPVPSGRWQVRRKWMGWTVIDPEGRIHMTTGASRSEWVTAVTYAHHTAGATA